jgi:outer membrane protein assembly factor BamE (lipoprotein component of BamABCDE complex)
MIRKFKTVSLIAFLSTVLALTGCVQYQSAAGVKNTWREIPTDQIQKGVTTQAEILDWLGPPSQVIALGEQTVFYYLSQLQSGQSKILIVWNDTKDQTRYDRAIFFFSQDGILTEFSIRDETTKEK